MSIIRKAQIIWIVCLALVTAGNAYAGDREQARRIHDRLVGTPPSPACLDQLQSEIATNAVNAALDAITDDGAGDACIGQDFYRVTLKNFVTPWTNEEQTVFAPLNDYTATVIGIIRDEYDFRRILFDDIIYTGNGSISPAYAVNSNAHYEEMSNTNADLQAILVEKNQTDADTLNLPSTSAAAGIMTTRQGARAFFIDGTNRAMFRFTMLNHLCTDLEQIKDTSRPPDRIRQDVSRSPGGDSRIFMNACVGCHAGMDPMAQAFAYYNYSYTTDEETGVLEFTNGAVQPKYHINASNFEYGYNTPDDHWDNYWRKGPNSNLGWGWAPSSPTTGSGNGASSLGRELADSYAFARCQVEKVFKAVCLRAPVDTSDRSQIDSMITSFRTSGFNLKQVFAESAVFCKGD